MSWFLGWALFISEPHGGGGGHMRSGDARFQTGVAEGVENKCWAHLCFPCVCEQPENPGALWLPHRTWGWFSCLVRMQEAKQTHTCIRNSETINITRGSVLLLVPGKAWALHTPSTVLSSFYILIVLIK